MQEFDAILKSAIRVQSELWSMIATLPGVEGRAGIEVPLTFNEKGHIISWKDKSERFTPSTFRLVQQLWLAPDHTLSKEDVREGVNEDEYASNEAVWTCLKRARKEMEAVNFPYEIETLRGKGYRLIAMSGT